MALVHSNLMMLKMLNNTMLLHMHSCESAFVRLKALNEIDVWGG